MNIQDDEYCFACGKKNPIGLKMEFTFEDNKAISHFVPSKEHQGWKDITHGGIIFTLLDESMAKLLIKNVGNVVTFKSNVTFLKPLKIGEKVTVEAQIDKIDKKRIHTSAQITDEKGNTLAQAKAIFIKV